MTPMKDKPETTAENNKARLLESHLLLMRQMADLTGSPIEHMSGDAVVYHFRDLYPGTLILNVGINAAHGARLVSEEAGATTSQTQILLNASALMPHLTHRGQNFSTATRQRAIRTIRP